MRAAARPAQNGGMDEIVGLYDDAGRECGSAPRSRMRRENLRHGATAIVVLDPAGRIFVHRRTETKDLYPGRLDFAAGGVMRAGEGPAESAAREAFEELGVTSPLTPIGEGDYADARTSAHAFLFFAVTDEPLRFQPEEVAGGEWMTREELVAAVETFPERFMPDTVALLLEWVQNYH